MGRISACIRLAIAAFLLLNPAPLAAQDEDQNLLQLPGIRHVVGLGTTADSAQVAALIDGNAETVAHLQAVSGAPADLVFDVGSTVAPRELTIRLSAASPANFPVRVDLLVSDTSPASGFHSLKAEALTGLEAEVTLDFQPASARWIMLRLYPLTGVQEIQVGDIGVIGRLGPPQTRYAFGESPAAAIEVLRGLAELEPSTFEPEASEMALFARLRSGQVTQQDFETAALLASGVRDTAAVHAYIARIDEMETDLRSQLDVSAPPAVLGAQLLEWMHKSPMRSGYVAHQTDLSVVLDQASFNCVSSAVLYAALGRRLGLDVRGIEVPDHAFAILYDGADHMDVETTTAQGFNPARDHVAEFEALTGFVYIPEAHRDKRREISPAGMAALIYYNHGVQALEEGRYRDALLANFRALNLDPEFSTAATNALAALGRWSDELGKAGRWEEAARVAATGTRLAPNDAGLAAARLAVWQGWAGSLADSGKPEAAVALLERAKTEMPDADLDDVMAWIFIRPGEELAQRGAWDAALQAVDPGRSMLQGAPRDAVEDWRRGLFLRWTSDSVQRSDFSAAASTLLRAWRDYPASDDLERMLRFVAQEAARTAPDFDSAVAELAGLKAKFPGSSAVPVAAEAYVAGSIQLAHQTQPLDAALAMVGKAAALLSDEQATDLGALVFETYGHPMINGGDWPAAAAIYAEGLSKFPDSYVLETNALYIAQQWRSAAFDEGGPAALEAVNKTLAGLFPSFDRADGEDAIRRKIADLVQARDFDGAEAVLNEGQLVLAPDSVAELGAQIVDSRVQRLMAAEAWQEAAAAYAAGLARFPDSWSLQNNAVYVAQEWTRAAEKTGGAPAVMETAAALRELFPGNEDIATMGTRTLKRSMATRIEAKDYDSARGIIAAVRPALTAEETHELVLMLFSAWSSERIAAKDWPEASRVLAEGIRALPGEYDLERNAAYVVQEWSAESLAATGAAGFVAAAEMARDAFPELPAVQDTLVSVLGRELERNLAEGRAEDALTLLDDCSPAFAADGADDLREFVYERWARAAADANNMTEAVRIYDLGLTELPQSALLKQNRDYFASKIP